MKFLYAGFLCGWMALLLSVSIVTAQTTENKEYKPLLLKNAARLGITPAEVNDAIITNAYTDPASQITYIYLQQAYHQIKVYNTVLTASFRNGSLLYHSGAFINDIAAKAGSIQPVKTHTDAIRLAARHLQLNDAIPLQTVADVFTTEKKYTVAAAGIARRDIDVTLMWTPSGDKQQVVLTWNVNIDVPGREDWWNVRINALTGEYVEKDNWTVYEQSPDKDTKEVNASLAGNTLPLPEQIKPAIITHIQKRAATSPIVLQSPPPGVTSATYRVIPYPIESPIAGSFSNEVNPWLMAGAGNNATTHGWHFDGTTDFNITRGNNVFAFLDRRANDLPDATLNWPDTSATAIPTLNFVHNLNAAEQPFHSIENKKVALDNLFYWNNLMHDISYQYGFTEPAGNFQIDNIGRGGIGNDVVLANAQDSAGYNNANFSAPQDGFRGRMQMYTFFRQPALTITEPASIAGNYGSIESNFSAPNKLAFTGPVTGQVVLYNDDATGTVHTACATAFNTASLAGKIALIDANTCAPTTKVINAQTAGATAVLMYSPGLFTMSGNDGSITIPAVSITTTDANAIIAQLNQNNSVTATFASGIYLDGDLDNGVICHEYGHGISTRLTGGPANASCLTNAEQGGEGWSDYFALMMTTNWNTAAISDGANLRSIAAYVYNQPVTGGGTRHYPYTTNMSVNPLTYANMAGNTEIHATGEIWCSALWDMTWNIIQQQGSVTGNLYNNAGNGGNVIAMNLVMTGLKLQPCGPGFLDSRNAILAADSILYNNAHKCAIWNAFARRGMGYSANQGFATNASDQVAAYDIPAGIQVAKPLPLIVSTSTQTTITHTAVCQCAPATGYILQDTIPAGFSYVSSTPAGTLAGNVLKFPATSFAALESKNFSIVLQTPATGCMIDSVVNDNREGNTTGGLVSSGSPAWVATTAKSHTPASSWFSKEAITTSSSFLTSGSFANAPAKNLSLLSFWHYFNTETEYDGGVVEYSTDNGGTWLDAGPFFIRNGYNKLMDPYSALIGRRAFTGTNVLFSQSQLNLSSFGTNPVMFRFRMESDDAVASDGWYVDDIIRANGCGDILKTGLYDNAGIRQDTAMLPMFVKPAVILPLNLLWFYASPIGSQVALDWKTQSEINVQNFAIEWSKNGTDWTTIYTVNAGNRTTNSYNTIHTTPVEGNNYYRIRMNDADGKFAYSPVRVINMNEKGKPALVLVPNPVSTDVVLYLSKELKATSIKIYDAAGSLVSRLAVGAGVQQLKISTTTLATGMYTVEATGAQRFITRMLVQH